MPSCERELRCLAFAVDASASAFGRMEGVVHDFPGGSQTSRGDLVTCAVALAYSLRVQFKYPNIGMLGTLKPSNWVLGPLGLYRAEQRRADAICEVRA